MSNNQYLAGYKFGLAEGILKVLDYQNPDIPVENLRKLFEEFLEEFFDNQDDIDYFLSKFDEVCE